MFDLPDLQPIPLSLPLQELPDLTVSLLARSAEGAREALGAHAVTLERLQVCPSRQQKEQCFASRKTWWT